MYGYIIFQKARILKF